MFSRRKLSLKMKKFVVLLVFVLVLSQLGNAFSTTDIVPANTGDNELADPDAHNIINLEDDTEQNKKPVVLLVPVGSSEEDYDFQDESEEGETEEDEEDEEEEEIEDIEEVPHLGHKTKRCKSPNSLRKVRRIPALRNPRKYISVSTESSIDESLEIPIAGKSLFRVASVKDAKQILKNLLKSRPSKREDNNSSERVSKPNNQDSIRLFTKDSGKQGKNRPKKYFCYCVEEDCDMNKSGKKPSRPYAVKKRITPNILGKNIYTTSYENQEGLPGFLNSEHILGAPHNLICPSGSVLMEEPEYLGQSPTRQQKKRRPVKKCPQPILSSESEAHSLGQPTKIRLPLAGNRKWNRRVYKVDKKSPFAQKLQSAIEQKEAENREPCTEPEETFADAQDVQDYYNNEQSNFNQYHQLPIDTNIVYPGPYVVYPHYSQYPQYGDGLYDPIPMEPADQGIVSHQDPSHDQYVPIQMGEDHLYNPIPFEPANQVFYSHQDPSHDQYVQTQVEEDYPRNSIPLEPANHGFVSHQKISPNHYELTPLGRNFVDLDQCIKLFGPNFCIVTTTTISSLDGPKYANNCDDELEASGIVAQRKDKTYSTTKSPRVKTSRYPTNRLGATQKNEENVHQSEEYPEDQSEEHGDRTTLRHGYNQVATSPYPNRPLEDSESEDYSENSEEFNGNEVIEKRPQESITEHPVLAIPQNSQGAHKISVPQYIEYTVKPGKENAKPLSSEDPEDTTEFIQNSQDSSFPDRSEFRYSTNGPSNKEPNESTSLRSYIVKMDVPEDNSRTTLQVDSQKGFPEVQRVATEYPIIHKEDTSSTSLRMHPSNRKNEDAVSLNYDVYPSTVPEQVGTNFEANLPKTTSSHRQFVGITQTTPVDHYSKPGFVSSAAIGGNSHHATMGDAGYSTTPLLGENQPEERTYASESYSNSGDSVEFEENNTEKVPTTITQSGLGDTVNKHLTTKMHSYYQSKQPKTSFESEIAKTTSAHRNFVGRTQSTPVDNFSKSGIISSSTIGGNNQYTTSYASMADLRHATTPLLGENEPEERIYSSTIYPTTNDKNILLDNPEYEETDTEEIPSSMYDTTRSRIVDTDENKYFTTPRTFYPSLVESHHSTLVDSSTQPEQLGANFATRKIDSKTKSGNIADAETSYATMEDIRYDTTPLLGEYEPQERVFTSYSPYPTTIDTEEHKSSSSLLQQTGELDQVNTEKIPSSLYYTTKSEIANVDDNKWSKVGKTNPHRQFIEVAQSIPQNDFSQPGVASTAMIGTNSHYTTSYATMEDTEHTITSILGANEPEEGIFRSTTYPTMHKDIETTSSWQQENKEQHPNDIQATAWTHNYPTQSNMQDQHFTTEENYYPQFVGSHQSTNGVSSSTDLYPGGYFTAEGNSYPQFGAETPEDVGNSYNQAQSRNWYYSTANQQTTTEQSAHRQFVPSHYSTPAEMVPTTKKSDLLRLPATDSSKLYWPPTTERSESQSFSTQSKRPYAINNHGTTIEQDNLGLKMSSGDDYSDKDIRNWYTTTGSNLDSGRSNPSGDSNELISSSEDEHNQAPEETFGNSFKHSGATPGVDHDSGIKEESKAYFTSKSYDDNIAAVTGPDSYFEGGGLKSWKDFTSMSSDDFTIGDVNRAEGIKQATIIDGMTSQEEGRQTTEVSPRRTTYYEVVGEELPYKERTINEESQETPTPDGDDFSSTKTQIKNKNTDLLHPGKSYVDEELTTDPDKKSGEEIGKPIHQSDSNTPISNTHYFESHSTSPQILEGENKILDNPSTENLSSKENDRLNPEEAAIDEKTNVFDYNDGNSYSSVGSNNLPSTIKTEGSDSSEDDSIDTVQLSDANDAMQRQPESSEKVKSLFSDERPTQPDDITTIPNSNQPSENYDYTNDYSSLEKSSPTEFAKYHDDYMNSEARVPSKSSESVAAPFDRTASNMLRPSTTIRSVNYDDYRDSDEPQRIALHPNYNQQLPAPTLESTGAISNVNQPCPENRNVFGSVSNGDYRDFGGSQRISLSPYYNQQQPAPTLDLTHEISNINQLLPEEKYILRTAAELVVNELVSGTSEKPDINCRVSPNAVGAPNQGLLPGLPELPILKNLFSLPEVRNMAIHTVRGLLSEISGVPQESSLGRLSDHLINSILNRVVDDVLPGPVTTTSSGMVDEHRFENGHWTVVPASLVPKDDRVALTHDDKILNAIENIVGRPGIGIQGARLPAVQNIIVQTVENILNRARHIADNSVIWDLLDRVIARAEEPGKVYHRPAETVRPMIKVPDIKKPSGSFKDLPVIPIVEHVVKNGEWSEKQTVLGDKRKNFDFATNNRHQSSTTSCKSVNSANQFGYNTKANDYAFMGESEEDDEFRQGHGYTNGIAGMTKNVPANIKNIHDNNDDLENTPIKYYSPNDRILSYIKNHLQKSSSGIVGSQSSKQLYATTDNSVKFAQAMRTDNSGFSSGTDGSSIGSNKKKICTCKEEEEKVNGETVGSGLQESQISTEEENFSKLPTNIHNVNENVESATANYVGKGHFLTTNKSHRNSGEELDSTESSESSSTIHHLQISDEASNDYTTEEYVGNENSLTTEEIDQNSEEEEASIEMTESNESRHTTPVFVYGVPVGNTQSPKDKSGSDEETDKITNKEYIGAANVLTTEEIDVNSEEASNEMTEDNQSRSFSDITKEILKAENHRQTDQSITTPVLVYGASIKNTQFPGSTLITDEPTEESTNKEYIGAANVLSTETFDQNSEEEMANGTTENNVSRASSDVTEEILGADNHIQTDQRITTPVLVYGAPVEDTQSLGSTSINDAPTEGSTNKEYIGTTNILTTETFDKNSEEEVASKIAQNNESRGFSDVTEEILEAENHRQTDQRITTPVLVYGAPVEDTQSLGSTSINDAPTEGSTNKEYIGTTNILTTETFDKNSEEEVASKIAQNNESRGFSDVTEEIFEAENHRQTDQRITTPVLVYGSPVEDTQSLGNTSINDAPTEGSTNKEYIGTTNTLTTETFDQNSEEEVASKIAQNNESRGFSDVTEEILEAENHRQTDQRITTPVLVYGAPVEDTQSLGSTSINDSPTEGSTNKEYMGTANILTTETFDRNTEEEVASKIAQNNESRGFSDVTEEILEAENRRQTDQRITTPVLVYGAPVEDTQFLGSTSINDAPTEGSTNKEYIGTTNILTTETFDQNSEEEVASKIAQNNESRGFSDVTEEILEAENHRQTDQRITTPVLVYGAPVEDTQFLGSTSINDAPTEGSTNKEYIGTTNILTTETFDQNSEEEVASKIAQNNESRGFSDVTEEILEAENYRQTDQRITTPVLVYGSPVEDTQFLGSTSINDSPTEGSTNKEYIGTTNILTTETFDQNSEEEVASKIAQNDESHGFSDVTEEILEAENRRQTDQRTTTPVLVYGAPVEDTQFLGSTSINNSPIEGSTNKEYIGTTNTLTTETFDQNSEEEVASKIAQNDESHGFSDVTEEILEAESHRQTDQRITTPVFVYGDPAQNTQFPESFSRNYYQSTEPTNKGHIGSNVMTTVIFDKNSEEKAAIEMTENNESPGFSDVTEEILGADNHRHTDQSITTPVYVYGVPVQENNQPETTNWEESTTENLRHQFVKTSNHHDSTHHADHATTSINTESEGIIGNMQFPGSQITESHLNQRVDGQPEESNTEEYKLANALTTDSDDTSEIEASTESTKSSQSLSDVTSEILLAGSNRNTDDNYSTQVYVNGVPAQESTTQELREELSKMSKNYGSAQEASTSSQGLIGAARSRVGSPRQRLGRPRDQIVKQTEISLGASSNCVTPKYDPTYFGKISLNGVNPGGDSISDLANTDLYYVGDGVKLPLTIQRMPDGSFALSISEKICENFVKRKCPCCVPREGDIVEERRQSNEAEDEEYSPETNFRQENNYDAFEPTESAEFQGKSKKRFVRSTSGSEVVVTSATPVESFVKKYNLTLTLEDNSPIANQRNNEGDKIKNTRRKNRLRSSKDTKIRNLFENNNEIQRDDSEETAKRAIDDDNSDTDLKESNSIRKAVYTYDTGTNDFFQSLLHIKDVPEDKRTEIVLNALDGLVNSASAKIQIDGFGNSVEKDSWDDQSEWEGSDEYDLKEMENEMAKYGYQKDNPILERIRFIKAQQNSHGQYKYQRNIDPRAKGKMNMLKTVLHWLRELFLETNSNKPS